MLISTKHLVKADAHYNSSIIKYKDTVYLAYRYDKIDKKKQKSNVVICKLDKKFQPIKGSNIELALSHPYKKKGSLNRHEDPRLFIYNDELHCAYINFSPLYNRANQGFCKLNAKLKAINLRYPAYGENLNGAIMQTRSKATPEGAIVTHFPANGIEKNWSFFEHNNKLCAIYKINPMEVIEIKKNPKVLHKSKKALKWDHGQIRGGTPPVKVGDEYFGFFHSSKRINGVLTYVMGAYAFDNKFKITKISKKPIMVGDLNDKKRPAHLAVVFPCGAFIENGIWTISYGYNDHSIGIVQIPHEKILKGCKTV